MQIEEMKTEGLKREYKVVIEAAELTNRLETILKDFQANAKINGFRPGKAPLSLLKKMHGDRAMGQVLNEAVNENTEKLFAEKSLRPATRPEVDVNEFEDGKDLGFTVAVEILPEINVDDFKAPSLERWVADVADKDVNDALDNMASQQKVYKKAPKTTKAKDGEAVLIDFVGKIDGTEFDGGKGEDFELVLGSGQFIPGFEEQLIGTKAGDEKTLKVAFPADYQSEDLKGKDAEFDVIVKEVRKASEAKVDDDLAKNMGLDDLDALKEAIKGQLQNASADLTRARLKRGLLDSLADSYDFEVPAGMVDMEFGAIWEQIKRDAVMNGESSAEDFEGKDGPDDAEEAAEFRSIAERRVRLGLLLSEIGIKNEVQVTSDEINRKVFEEARRYPGQEQQVFEFYQKNEQARAQLRAPIFEEKVVDFILESADLKDKTVSREDLEKAVQALDEEEDVKPKKKAAKKKPAKKAAAEKTPAKKAPAKKAAAEKAPAKKAPAKKAPAKKAPAKKAPAKKVPAKKPSK